MPVLLLPLASFSLIGALIAMFFPLAVFVLGEFPAAMTLQRAFPVSHPVELSQLRARDRSRHDRMLQPFGSFIDFPVNGTYNPFVAGLYYTKIQLGSPPKEFNVHIDTGSDVSWVNCYHCKGCPNLTRLDVRSLFFSPIELETFDPSDSKTAVLISCSDQRCALDYISVCPKKNKQCMYQVVYGDGSKTEGFYVLDLMHFDKFAGNMSTKNISAPVVFGCSILQKGEDIDAAVDGILGFGQQPMSIISQLSLQQLSPNAFSHCLKGSGDGGVNGKKVAIDPDVFAPSHVTGTIIDSGTTLAYIAPAAYDPFMKAIREAVSKSVRPFPTRQFDYCYEMTSSVSETFPAVSFNFVGGASMNIKPDEYLLMQGPYNGDGFWCIAFTKNREKVSILGDLLLKDKVIVYDIEGQQIGWANYNCQGSLPYNVTTPKTHRKKETFGEESDGDSSLSGDALYKPTPTTILQLREKDAGKAWGWGAGEYWEKLEL
ncbi:hypothetical protein LguiA_021261 [Lonicera macranthoides]